MYHDQLGVVLFKYMCLLVDEYVVNILIWKLINFLKWGGVLHSALSQVHVLLN